MAQRHVLDQMQEQEPARVLPGQQATLQVQHRPTTGAMRAKFGSAAHSRRHCQSGVWRQQDGTGAAKAWVSFDGTNCPGGYCVINASYNVSGVYKAATGNYLVYLPGTFTPWAASGSCSGNGASMNAYDRSSTYLRVQCIIGNVGYQDSYVINIAVHGL